MVSPEVTQPVHPPHPRPTDWKSDESVRITAEDRRQVLREHYEQEHTRQAAVSAFECNDLKVLRRQGRPTALAELRASNAAAVLQHIADNLAAYSGNRDFRGVTR